MRLDAVIFGGGVAGLWTLDRLTRQGCHALLLESQALGFGQTVGSQGIIHGGLKYSLHGWLTKSAQHIKRMPDLWRQSLAGKTAPFLTKTQLRADACYLWQSDSLTGMAGMLGAKLGLRVAPESLREDERPEILRHVPGSVARLPEQVIDPVSFLAEFRDHYADRILLIDADDGLNFELNSPGEVAATLLQCQTTGRTLRLEAAHTIFTAGSGNASLRKKVGLNGEVTQRRPLHMVMLRGDVPELNGHCIDGMRTRVTITTSCDEQGRRVWQVGGQLAEDGVRLTPSELTQRAASEIQAVLPQLDLQDVEWSTYRVDRAEAATDNGGRPDTVQVLCAGNVTTAWPTKLALAPVLADEIAARVVPRTLRHPPAWNDIADWPRPPVAQYPWDDPQQAWWTVETAPAIQRPREDRRAA